MNNIVIYDGHFKLTLRELLASLAIVFLMITFGFFIHGKIHDSAMETNERYMKSPIVTSMDMYDYVKETGVGDVFTIFELKAVEPQTIPELNGEYLYIEKIKEKYTMHTRTVTSTDAKGRVSTSVQTYYTWDYSDSTKIKSNDVVFNGDIYPFDKFDNYDIAIARLSDVGSEYLDKEYRRISGQYAYENSKVRYYFKVIPAEMNGSVFVTLKDDEIQNRYVTLYSETEPEELRERLINDSNFSIFIFWFFWIILTGGLVFGFYVLDNKWLNA